MTNDTAIQLDNDDLTTIEVALALYEGDLRRLPLSKSAHQALTQLLMTRVHVGALRKELGA